MNDDATKWEISYLPRDWREDFWHEPKRRVPLWKRVLRWWCRL